MSRALFAGALLGALSLPAAGAHAQKAPPTVKLAAPHAAPAPRSGPPRPSAETRALAPMLANFTWTGSIKAGAMGPGTPATQSHGKQRCHFVDDGLWAACDMEDVAGTGAAAQRWVAHLFYGWDFENRAYRAVGVDNFGTSYHLAGKIEGKKLVWESLEDTQFLGQSIRFRFTFDFTDPSSPKLTDERSLRGAPFVLGEEAILKMGS